MPQFALKWPGQLTITGKREDGPCRGCGAMLRVKDDKRLYNIHKEEDNGWKCAQRRPPAQTDDHHLCDPDAPGPSKRRRTVAADNQITSQHDTGNNEQGEIEAEQPDDPSPQQTDSENLQDRAPSEVDEDDAELLVGIIRALADYSSEDEAEEFDDEAIPSDGELEDITDIGIEDNELTISNTAKSFLARREAMLYDGAPGHATIQQLMHTLGSIAVHHNLGKEVTKDLLKCVGRILPQNSIPKSEHLLWKFLGAKTPQEFSHDGCAECGQHYFGRTVTDSKRRIQEYCPSCKASRYVQMQNGNLHPAGSFFYLGVRYALQQLFHHPEVYQARMRDDARQRHLLGTIMGSNRVAELNAATGNMIWEEDAEGNTVHNYETVVVSAASDYFAPCRSKEAASIGCLALRCDDLPGDMLNKRKYHKPVAIFSKSKLIHVVLKLFVNELLEFGPGTDGLKVALSQVDDDGRPRQARQCTLNVLLNLYHADMPHRAEVMKYMGSPNAVLACPYCRLNGHYREDVHRIVHMGYAAPVMCTVGLGIPQSGASFQVHVDGRILNYSMEDQLARGTQFEALKSNDPGPTALKNTAKSLGCKGVSELYRLPYLTQLSWTPCTIAFYHAALLGLVKDLLEYATSTRAKSGWKIKHSKVKQLEDKELLIVPKDAGRLPAPLRLVKSWLIEHSVRFVAEYSPFFFNEEVAKESVLEPQIAQAWKLLREYVMYHLTAVVDDSNDDGKERWRGRTNAATASILAYAKLLEREGMVELLSFNLHQLVCHSSEFELQCGLLRLNNELFVERIISLIKSTMGSKGTNSNNIEFTIVKNLLMQEALYVFQAKCGGGVLPVNKFLHGDREMVPLGEEFDPIYREDGGAGGQCGLAGRGHRLTDKEVEESIGALEKMKPDLMKDTLFQHKEELKQVLGTIDQYRDEYGHRAFMELTRDLLQPYKHTEAHIHQVQMITSTSSSSVRRRNSSYLQVKFIDRTPIITELRNGSISHVPGNYREEININVVQARYYLRIKVGTAWLRLAMCRRFKDTKHGTPGGLMHVKIPSLEASSNGRESAVKESVPILLTTISTPLLGWDAGQTRRTSNASPRGTGSPHLFLFHIPHSSSNKS